MDYKQQTYFYIIYLFLPARAFPFDPSKVKFSLKIACQDKGLRYQLKNKSKVQLMNCGFEV